jgi:hypothetical protein
LSTQVGPILFIANTLFHGSYRGQSAEQALRNSREPSLSL